MLKIVSNDFLRMLGIVVENDQVPSSTSGDFVCNMSRKDELALVPTDLDLVIVSISCTSALLEHPKLTRLPRIYKSCRLT